MAMASNVKVFLPSLWTKGNSWSFVTFCFYATSVNQALVYIRRKLMCNSLQLVGIVHPYYASNKTCFLWNWEWSCKNQIKTKLSCFQYCLQSYSFNSKATAIFLWGYTAHTWPTFQTREESQQCWPASKIPIRVLCERWMRALQARVGSDQKPPRSATWPNK